MNTRHPWIRSIRSAAIAACLITTAGAQTAPVAALDAKKDEAVKLDKFVVTGSSIARITTESALPVQIIRASDMEQQGIASAEQLIANLNINGNGLDNLAANADVVSGAQRGNNGATSANLRGQGSSSTLVLLNGRRVAAHGLNGGIVDLNQIPMAALDRVEILKDGASSTYGTDAIGGVINFITKENFTGLVARAASDVTELGGGNIFRGSITAGWGDLSRGDKFNLLAVASIQENKRLRGDQRDWNTTFQSARGLSPDTRGTVYATATLVTSLYSALSRDNLNTTGRSTGPVDPLNPSVTINTVNLLNLPGGAGFAGTDMAPYDYQLWSNPGARYAAAWDTGRANVLQQPVRNMNLVLRGTFKLGEHKFIAEGILGRSQSTKSFSPNQVQTSTSSASPLFNLAYPSAGADYTRVFDTLLAYFPGIAANRNLPIAFRWRAVPMGNRELYTQSDTSRFLMGLEGPLPYFSKWEYRAGAAVAESEGYSILNRGYFYGYPLAALFNTGQISPFKLNYTPQDMALLDAVRADGVRLYGGKTRTTTFDFTTSGPLWTLPAGDLMGAIGADVRTEKYFFVGDDRANPTSTTNFIFNAPFDNTWATTGTLTRKVKAVFGELEVPVIKGLDVNASIRSDDYTGFGRSTNPKYSFRWTPHDKILFRGSYSTGFRVPEFRQIFNAPVLTAYTGRDIADPASGSIVVTPTNPPVQPNLITGGKLDLGPEEAKLKTAGIVIQANKNLSFGLDWWEINKTGTIQNLDFITLARNYSLFQDRFIRDTSNALVAVDTRPINAGESLTRGLEYSVQGKMDFMGGKLSGNFELAQLLDKKSKLITTSPWGNSEIGRFTRSGDLGLKYKYTASIGYSRRNWSGQLINIYRAGYMDSGAPPGAALAPQWNPKVDEYSIYHLAVTYKGFKNMTVIAGIKNLFNTDPPFTASFYDSSLGSGSAWEPRVADPRGRSFTLSVEYKFL